MPQWISRVLPFVQGAVGWSAASFVVETFVRPSRGRRRLAHVLAQEVGHDLELLVLQLEYFQIAPNELPADLHLADGVYRAVLDRIGELSDKVTGELILFYERIASINNQKNELATLIDAVAEGRRDPDRHGGASALELKQERLARGVQVFKGTFIAAAQQGDKLLRQLRVAETFLGRFGYWFRKKPTLDPAEARQRVTAHREALGDGGSSAV